MVGIPDLFLYPKRSSRRKPAKSRNRIFTQILSNCRKNEEAEEKRISSSDWKTYWPCRQFSLFETTAALWPCFDQFGYDFCYILRKVMDSWKTGIEMCILHDMAEGEEELRSRQRFLSIDHHRHRRLNRQAFIWILFHLSIGSSTQIQTKSLIQSRSKSIPIPRRIHLSSAPPEETLASTFPREQLLNL